MKNFQANHGQCDSIIFPQNIFFSRLKALAKLELCLADSMIHYFGCVLETVHIFNIELHVLKFLLVRGSNKKQRRGRIIFNLTEGETFVMFYDNQVLLGIIL